MNRKLLLCLLPILSFGQPGSLDTSFDPGTGANNWVWSNAIKSDGKIIIGGDFTSYSGTASNRLARLNADGSLDADFDVGTGVNNRVQMIATQSDGKILIAGYFTLYNGTAINRIARLNSDASLDTSFNLGTGANLPVFALTIQNDGKILIGGQFTSFNGTAINRIARINEDGSLDDTFDPGLAANFPVETISVQNDGKIIVVGGFTIFNGISRNRVVRLNSDGSVDDSFNPGIGANAWIYSCSIQSDGKIILGGEFTSFNGIERNRIVRLNNDGSLDNDFVSGTGSNDWVYRTLIQSDDKIIIGGPFTSFNGISRSRIARLNSDGSLDNLFDPGTGTSNNGALNWVFTISIQNDEKIFIGGAFISYNGTTRNNIARIFSEDNLGINELTNDTKKFILYPNPFSDIATLITKSELNNATLTLYNSAGQIVKETKNISGHTTLLNRDHLPAGLYIIKMSYDNQILITDKILIVD